MQGGVFRMKPDETKEQFIELRAKGLSFDNIAKELGVSKQTLINWSKELSLEVSNIKAIQLEALQEKYYILKEKRIELFGEKLKAINDELSKRDLSDIPTERLLDLLGK
jgi:transposase